MSAIYDNWEKLVAAVLKKEQLWQLFNSDSASISSDSSGFSFCKLTSSLNDVIAAKSLPRIHVEEPIKTVSTTSKPARKRGLKIQVPEFRFQDAGYSISEYRWRVSPRTASPSVSPTSGGLHSMSETKQQSYPLPLPPGATFRSPPVSPTIPPAKSPPAPPCTPKKYESVESTWKKGKLIGRSTLGNVYLGFNSEKGEMCAIKEARLLPNADVRRDARMMEKDIALLSRMKHPNVVQYFGSEVVGDNFYVYLEYVSGGSIHAILQEYGKLGESVIRNYTQQILAGLAYLHSEHIVHGNIKAASIFVDPNGAAKLSNFIIEMNIVGRSNSSSLMDSPYWMAPEVIMNSNVRKPASDIWSLGCTVLEMATSKPPLSQYKGVMAMFKVSCQNELPTIPDHLSDVCKDFLRCCMQLNPLHRATASQLLEHPFLKSSSPLRKHMLASPSSGHPVVTNAVKAEDTDCVRSHHLFDLGKVVLHSSTASSRSSDVYTPRYVSAPVSPVGSPLLHPSSPQQFIQPKFPPMVTNAMKLEDTDCVRSHHLFDSGKVVLHSSTASSRSSDVYAPRYVSAPVSPVGSPLLHPSSPQQFIQPKFPPMVTNAMKSEDTDCVRSHHLFDLGKVVLHSSTASSRSSDVYTPRYVSAPVSPVGSPLLHPSSPQQFIQPKFPPMVTNAMKLEDTDCVRSHHLFDSGKVVLHSSTASSRSRYVSAPVSPVGSPLLHPSSPQQFIQPKFPPMVTNAMKSEDTDCVRSHHLFDLGKVVLHSSTASSRSSDVYTPRYVSAPVSPVGSPLLHPSSPQQFIQPKFPPMVTNAMKLEDTDCVRSHHLFDSGKVVLHSSTASSRSSDVYTPRYVSAPVSPVGSPLLHPSSPQQFIQPKFPPMVTNAMKSEDTDCVRSHHLFDLGKVVLHSSTASSRSSDVYTPRYVSAPVSPVGSPLLHPSSPQQFIQPKFPPMVTNAMKLEDTDCVRSHHLFDSGKVVLHSSTASSRSSDVYAPRYVSAPVSPVGSPLLHPSSPQQFIQPKFPPMVTNAMKSEDTDCVRSHHLFDLGKVVLHSSTASSRSSDVYTPRYVSAPVSPVGSPLLHPSSPQQFIQPKFPPMVTNAMKLEDTDCVRSHHLFDSGKVVLHSSTASSRSSDIYTPRYVSAPVSPVGSPLLHPSSPQQFIQLKFPPMVTNAMKPEDTDCVRSHHLFDSGKVVLHSSTSSSRSSDIYTPRYVSAPVSPVGSPLLHPSSPQQFIQLKFPPMVTNAMKPEDTDCVRSHHLFDSGKVVFHSSTASSRSSDIYTPRYVSAPVSPVGSPLLHPSSPQQFIQL
ncbi:uncharacterized protein LOC121747676 isoform X5 [Salvia splendens]|uniref:uncharacterized protein LOC121747676 isoform X5 n=1 Tax=Salvia splendens TaxID=180675 RepID=UPI001C27DDB9|nr:uncharacterized protein LOC121747676 isoform X5 [Salvia splendens]